MTTTTATAPVAPPPRPGRGATDRTAPGPAAPHPGDPFPGATHAGDPRPGEPRHGDPVIAVEHLAKAYGAERILTDVSFAVAPGEIFGLLGSNGAGKTTTVEIVQGLRTRTGGSVGVLGLDPARRRDELRPLLGAQLQSSALPDRLRVGEALRLFAGLAGDVVDWRTLRDAWELGPLERRPFAALSGGQRQRLFLALALVNRPQVVFLDELTQGLDPVARRETWRLVRQVRAQGATVVLVSHAMDEVEALCDRLAVLHAGRIVACDTPAALVQDAGGEVVTRFSSTGLDAADLDGLARLPFVDRVVRTGAGVAVAGDPGTPVVVAAELARRGVVPTDFTVIRPTLDDVFVRLTTGASA